MNRKNLFRKEVLDLPAYTIVDEHTGVKLNQNESPWDIPVALKAQVIENLLKIDWNRYPLGDLLQLKKKMAKTLKLWPDNLVFANGSNVLVQALILATAVKKKILVVDPTFSVYELEGKLLGNKIIQIPLGEDFSLPVEACLEAIRREKPSIIFIPNPNAPTGNLFDREALRTILEAAPCLVVIDEAYYPFSETTVSDWIGQYDHLVVLRTFSKAFAMGGVRLGWLMADPEVAQQVEKCLLPFCINRLALATALTILDNLNYVDEYVKKIIGERKRVFDALSQLPTLKVHPSSANYILFEVNDAKDTFSKLLKEKIIVRQVSDGRRLTQALRVTIGDPRENDFFLKGIQKICG